MKLHNYQMRGILFAVENKQTFHMLDAGLGKTAIALKTIEALQKPALVIAPLRVASHTWPEEIYKWTPNLTYTLLHGKDKDIRFGLKRNIYLLNYDGLPWFYKRCVKGGVRLRKMIIILDESSFVKDQSTLRFHLMKKLQPIMSDYRMCLSATPAPNGLHELWPQYYFLDRGKRLGKAFTSFRDKHFTYVKESYKTFIKPGKDADIFKKIEDITYRLKAADYIEMPPISYVNLPVVLTPALQAQYDKLDKQFCVAFNEIQITAKNATSLSMKLRQFIQGAMYTEEGDYVEIHTIKAQILREKVEGLMGQPILIPINFRFEVPLIEKVMGEKAPVIHGGTSDAMANKYIDMWNEGKLPYLLCHPASIGHGMNLQVGGCLVLWYSMTWSLDHYKQLNWRLHRQGQKQAVVIHNVVMHNTLDTVIVNVLRQKDATQNTLLEALRQYTQRRLS